MFHILVSIKHFKEVELRILLTVFKCSLVLYPPHARPEIASCHLLWSPFPVQLGTAIRCWTSSSCKLQCSGLIYIIPVISGCSRRLLRQAPCSSVTFSLPCPKRRADAAKLSILDLITGVYCSVELNISFAWSFITFFFSPPPIFLTAVRVNQPPVAVASPKVQEVSLPTTSTFIDGSRMYWTILCLYPVFLIHSYNIIVCQLQVKFLLLTLLRSSRNHDLFGGFESSYELFYYIKKVIKCSLPLEDWDGIMSEAAASKQQLLLQFLPVLPRRPLCQYSWGHGRELST